MLSQKLRKSLKAPAAALAIALAASLPKPAEALTWAWKFTYANDLEASGTIESDGGTPDIPGTRYDILGISGTIGGANIIGLAPAAPGQTFWWSPPSTEILTDTDGITFIDSLARTWNIFNSEAGVLTINSFINDGDGVVIPDGGTVNSSFIAPVPSPLPVLGAAAAFSMSRKLRRRVSLAKSKI